jgi:hypothetical protein
MGYRSTFVTEDLYFLVPEWFVEKWPNIHYGEDDGKPAFPLAAKFERKFYSGAEDELFIDIARVLKENPDNYPVEATLVLLHEDGEVDRVIISPDKITLQGSLKYDPEDCYNPQLGDRDAVFEPKYDATDLSDEPQTDSES